VSSYSCAGELLTAANCSLIYVEFKDVSVIQFVVQIVFGLEFVLTESFVPKGGTIVKEN